jgi:hypothetical protein
MFTPQDEFNEPKKERFPLFGRTLGGGRVGGRGRGCLLRFRLPELAQTSLQDMFFLLNFTTCMGLIWIANLRGVLPLFMATKYRFRPPFGCWYKTPEEGAKWHVARRHKIALPVLQLSSLYFVFVRFMKGRFTR